MPETKRGDPTPGAGGRWRSLLPRHARERLFDPAIGLRLWLPRALVRNRRPTAFAWGIFATLVILVALVTVRNALEPHYVNAVDPYE